MRYQDKVVVVTGAASGIVAATALALAAEGATLVLGDRNADGLEAVADSIGGRALAVPFDAASADGCRNFIDQRIQDGRHDRPRGRRRRSLLPGLADARQVSGIAFPVDGAQTAG